MAENYRCVWRYEYIYSGQRRIRDVFGEEGRLEFFEGGSGGEKDTCEDNLRDCLTVKERREMG